MNASSNMEKVKVSVLVYATIDKVWKYWVTPECILKWNTASEDWHTVSATNDLRVGARFSYRMEAKDGSFGFDFWGIYEVIAQNELIKVLLGDGRKMTVYFKIVDNGVEITEFFEPEQENTIDMQRAGWQAILNDFKKIIESEDENLE